MDMETKKNYEGKALVMKENSPSKENKEEIMRRRTQKPRSRLI